MNWPLTILIYHQMSITDPPSTISTSDSSGGAPHSWSSFRRAASFSCWTWRRDSGKDCGFRWAGRLIIHYKAFQLMHHHFNKLSSSNQLVEVCRFHILRPFGMLPKHIGTRDQSLARAKPSVRHEGADYENARIEMLLNIDFYHFPHEMPHGFLRIILGSELRTCPTHENYEKCSNQFPKQTLFKIAPELRKIVSELRKIAPELHSIFPPAWCKSCTKQKNRPNRK